MKMHEDHDSLAGKRRYVRSLTRSINYLNDENFLKPIGRKENKEPSNTTQPSYNKQSTFFFEQGTKNTSPLFVVTQHLCEQCTYAIAKAKGTNDYQFVLCATHMQAFPTNRKCTAFKLDAVAN